MARKKQAKSRSGPDVQILKGRVYHMTQTRQWYGAEEFEKSLALLGAKVAAALDATVTHVVTAEGIPNKTTQKKIDSLVKKGAAIEVLDPDDVAAHISLPPKLIGDLLQGSDEDRATLEAICDTYRHNHPPMAIEPKSIHNLVLDGSITCSLKLEDVDFTGAEIADALLYDLNRSCFDSASLTEASIISAVDSSFRGADLSEANISGLCAGTSFDGANLSSAEIQLDEDAGRASDPPSFREADLQEAELEDIEFSGVDFAGARAAGSSWNSSTLRAALFEGADLSRCIMSEVDLREADLSNSQWKGATLTDVDLRGTRLDGADFSGAHLVEVKLDPELDRSSVKGLEDAVQGAWTVGPALKALDAAVAKARKVKIELRLRPGPQVEIKKGEKDPEHLMTFDASKSAYGFRVFNCVHSPGDRLEMEHTDTFIDGFKHNFGWCSSGEVRFETITVKTTKSPTPGPEIRELMIAALAEAFQQTPPDEKELKALTKAYRAELKKKQDAQKAQRAKNSAEYAERVKAEREEVDAKEAAERAARPEPEAPVADFASFAAALDIRADSGRVKNAKKMLKGSGFELFQDLSDPNRVLGIIKSQSDQDLVYAVRLDADGSFSCCTQNLRPCGGLRGALCKHHLVLLLGLVQAGALDPAATDQWVKDSLDKSPELNKDEMSDLFLKYKGAEAGEIDWRPTETVPEDFYSF